MPTEAYAHGGLCPRRPMPSRTSYESSKGYIFVLCLTFGDRRYIVDCSRCHCQLS